MKRLLCLFLLVCIFLSLDFSQMPASASNLQIYEDSTGEYKTYTGKRLSYIMNGAKVPSSELFGILADGYALAPYDTIFAEYYRINCSYHSESKKISMHHNGITIQMTLGSKTAVVNGKSAAMGIAPVKARTTEGKEKILVPTRFVSETFQMNYDYNSYLSNITIVKKMQLHYDSFSGTYQGTFGRIAIGNQFSNNHAVPVLQLGGTVYVSGYDVIRNELGIEYSYQASEGKISMSKGGIQLEMELGSSTASINGVQVDCLSAPILASFPDYNKEIVIVPIYFIAKVFTFDYQWETANHTAYIDVVDSTGVWKESLFYHDAAQDPQSNFPFDSSGNQYSTIPAVIYAELNNAALISEEYISAVENRNEDSIQQSVIQNDSSSFIRAEKAEDTLTGTETYRFYFSKPIYEVENLGYNESDFLTLRIPGTSGIEQNLKLSGDSLLSAEILKAAGENTLELQLLLSTKELAYDLQLSEDNLCLTVSIYKNYLKNLLYAMNQEGIEFIQIETLYPVQSEFYGKGIYEILHLYQTINPYQNKFFLNIPSEVIHTLNVLENSDNSLNIMFRRYIQNENIYMETSDNILTLYVFDDEDFIGSSHTQNKNKLNYFSFETPEGIEYQDIQIKDNYHEKEIIISIPGRHGLFYKQYPVFNTYEVVTDVLILENNDTTDIILTTSAVCGFELMEEAGSFELKVGSPDLFYDKIVVLDAGHGGYDPGAVKKAVNEKDLNLAVIQYTAEYMKDSDVKVYLTRAGDSYVDLYDRAGFASEVCADLFISLHMNANDSSAVNGTGVYYSKLNTNMSGSGLTSSIAAEYFAGMLSEAMKTKNNGKISGDFVVVKETKMPAVLIELGFMTHSGDMNKLVNKNMQKTAAKTLHEAVEKLLNTYPAMR